MSKQDSTKIPQFPDAASGEAFFGPASASPLELQGKILQDSAMSEPTLLRLHMGSALRYQAFRGETGAAPQSMPAADDCLWVFDSADLIAAHPDDGPRVKRPLSPASFSGESAESPDSPEGDLFTIPSGEYVFLQWRKADYPGVEEGIEDFVRQIWWEDMKTEGPWMLRTVREDDRVAYQGLRKISRS